MEPFLTEPPLSLRDLRFAVKTREGGLVGLATAGGDVTVALFRNLFFDRQLQGLRALNVTRAQGFLLATPMPADAIARLILEDHRWPAVTVAATIGRQL